MDPYKLYEILKRLDRHLEAIDDRQVYTKLVNCQFYYMLGQMDMFSVPLYLVEIQCELFDKLLLYLVRDLVGYDEITVSRTVSRYASQYFSGGKLVDTQEHYLRGMLTNIVKVYYQSPNLFNYLDEKFVVYDLILERMNDQSYHTIMLLLLRCSNVSSKFECWLMESNIHVVYLGDMFGIDFHYRFSQFSTAITISSEQILNKMLHHFKLSYDVFLTTDHNARFIYSMVILKRYDMISTTLQNYINQLEQMEFLEIMIVILKSDANCDILLGTRNNTIDQEMKRSVLSKVSKIVHELPIDEIIHTLSIPISYHGFNQTSTTTIYFQYLLTFFSNDIEINEKLMNLTILLLINTTMVGSPEFNLALNFLYEAYTFYNQFTSLDMDHQVPSLAICDQFQISLKSSKLDLSLLVDNMNMFGKLLTDIYCICVKEVE